MKQKDGTDSAWDKSEAKMCSEPYQWNHTDMENTGICHGDWDVINATVYFK